MLFLINDLALSNNLYAYVLLDTPAIMPGDVFMSYEIDNLLRRPKRIRFNVSRPKNIVLNTLNAFDTTEELDLRLNRFIAFTKRWEKIRKYLACLFILFLSLIDQNLDGIWVICGEKGLTLNFLR